MYIHLIPYLCDMINWNVFSWFDKNTVKHLRIPFSFHLMPVFLFALSQASQINWINTAIAFLVLHVFIYPASNGYNSYQDKDESSIGGLKNPPAVSKNLFYASLLFDLLGIVLSLSINIVFASLVLLYVLVSRAYSYRKLRLKKNPIIGFLTVFIFQGAFAFLMASFAISNSYSTQVFTINNVLCLSIASLFIGSVYPLTQIYQHESDKKDGVITLSYKLGYFGTFIFSATLFSVAMILLFYYFNLNNQVSYFIVFIIATAPVVLQLLVWFSKVKKAVENANFENTMRMNTLASTCMNIYFLVLIFNNYFLWF